MIKAYKMFTGPDGHAQILHGSVPDNIVTEASSIRFKETPAYSSYDWHTAPAIQYVITMTGELEFETKKGEKFMLQPGDLLIAMDTTGSGHKWRLINDEPWKRAYITFNETKEINFIADQPG